MSTDGIVQQLSKYGDYDEAEAWEVWLSGYMMKPAAARIADLRATDQWLETQDRPTREHASLITRRREMESIHRRLREAGR
jgi:hypothetical protein